MNDEDLKLEPIHRSRYRPLIIAALLIAGVGGAIATNQHFRAVRRAEGLVRASTAWVALRTCLVGDALGPHEQPSHRVRRTELGMAPGLRNLDPANRASEWPFRCAPLATEMTHALFKADSEEPAHRTLAVLASHAASALEAGELRTGAKDEAPYVDVLFAAVDQAKLPPPAQAAPLVLPPPDPPLLFPPEMVTIFTSEADLHVATDPVPGRALRVAFASHGTTKVCTWPAGATRDTSLRHAQCAHDALDREVSILGAYDAVTDLPTPTWVLVTSDGKNSVPNVLRAPDDKTSTREHDLAGGYVLGSTALVGLFASQPAALPLTPVVPEAVTAVPPVVPEPMWVQSGWELRWISGARALNGTASVATIVLPAHLGAGVLPLTAPTVFEHAVLATAKDKATGQTQLLAGAFTDGQTEQVTLAEIPGFPATVQNVRLAGCRSREALVVVAYGEKDHAALTFQTQGHWSVPLATDVGQGTLTCSGKEAVFTWMTSTPRKIHQTRCTPERCSTADADVPDYGGSEPVATDLNGKVLLVVSPEAGHGLRMRLAKLEHLDLTPDVPLVDDADHGGVDLDPVRDVFVRDGVAIALFSRKGTPGEGYAVRIAADGTFSAVTAP